MGNGTNPPATNTSVPRPPTQSGNSTGNGSGGVLPSAGNVLERISGALIVLAMAVVIALNECLK